MPELPEVETTRRGLERHLRGARIERMIVRDRRLRWPVPANLEAEIAGRKLRGIGRRAKYMLFDLGDATLIVHLGMSGRMRILPAGTPPEKHDHVDLVLTDGSMARFTDPRRFGSLHWVRGDPELHPLLRDLGPEPLGPAFDADWLHAKTRRRSAAIKLVLMDSHVVVGVGNIYASEALFRAGIDPRTQAGRLSKARIDALVRSVRRTLELAIEAGGSSMRDYVDSEGQAGYFQANWLAYGRAGEPCRNCGSAIRLIRQGQRATYFCPACQKR